MTGSKRGQVLRSSGILLMAGGLAVLSWCWFFVVRALLVQKQGAAALKSEIHFRPVNASFTPYPGNGALLGSVSIPRVGVSSIILEGADEHTLALSVGHIAGTAIPGHEGNVALAGHRDTFFRGLQGIRNGDQVLLTTSKGTRLYEVESVRVVSPEDVKVLDEIGRPVLTLVTCYPFHYLGSAPRRFVVRAGAAGWQTLSHPSANPAGFPFVLPH